MNKSFLDNLTFWIVNRFVFRQVQLLAKNNKNIIILIVDRVVKMAALYYKLYLIIIHNWQLYIIYYM